MLEFSPQRYGTWEELLSIDRCRSLGRGTPDPKSKQRLASWNLETAFAHHSVADLEMARCCLAGIWLLYDFLEESHTISQGVATATGSFWHGIMHRREGDFSNAKYWFRRVGEHDVFPHIADQASQLQAELPPPHSLMSASVTSWDPFAFVDACASAPHGSASEQFCRRLQQAEWELLFAFCFQRAIGS